MIEFDSFDRNSYPGRGKLTMALPTLHTLHMHMRVFVCVHVHVCVFACVCVCVLACVCAAITIRMKVNFLPLIVAYEVC